MNRLRMLAALVSAGALAACGEKTIQNITGVVPNSSVKFFNFGVNAPQVNFYADTVKLTAISSTDTVESTTGVKYGGASSGGYYSGLDAGQYTLEGKIASTTDKGLTVASVAAQLEAGKKYSFYMSGIYNTGSKTVEAFVVEDDVPDAFDYSTAYVRFVNAISNANPMTLYAKNDSSLVESPVGAAVAYKSAGAFTPLPQGAYDLNTRYVAGGANVISRAAVSFLAGHYYTITAFGDITASSGTNKPALDNTANR